MRFACPHCGQHLSVETMHQGVDVDCPSCGKPMTVPEKPSDEVVKTLQSTIDRGELTITQYMADQKLEGGVDLGDSQDGSTASQYITADQGQKYELGTVVATGGMGAILDAKEHNLRRKVAMKVVLNAEQATKEHVLRFIEEAQVTAQLEHPSIVPVHELGVDASGNVFYTMKMIHGQTLKQILKKIADGDGETIKEYPLSRLLNIFQRVCDAIAFAHHKHVIHRDLKPENIMVGEYGEVQVMDWGLAKVLGKPERGGSSEGAGTGNTMHIAVDSVRRDGGGDTMKTMDGAIMGTPGYMAPEQAEGALDEVDERSDIYSLGAILYSIITLNKPITFTTLDEFISKVGSGEIPHPTHYNPAKTTGNSKAGEAEGSAGEPLGDGPVHCPGRRVPESLAAVAMKALATKPEDRYQDVKGLQVDIEAYQNGFATSAEDTTAWRHIKLFVGRHRGIAVAVAAMMVLLLGVAGVYTSVNVRERRRAEGALKQWQEEQAQRQQERAASLPVFLRTAKRAVDEQDFETALAAIQVVVEYEPQNAEAWMLMSHAHVVMRNYPEAISSLGSYLKLVPDDENAKELMALCAGAKDMPPPKLAAAITDLLQKQEAYSFAVAMNLDEKKKLELAREKLKAAMGRTGVPLSADANGNWSVNFHQDSKLEDLSPLTGLPLRSFKASKCKNVADLSALRGMPLKKVDLWGASKVVDLSPLKGSELTYLDISGTGVRDLAPLKGMPLKTLIFAYCGQVTNISVLKGMPLERLNMFRSKGVRDLSPLEGMQLTDLNVSETAVVDLAPLEGMPLKELKCSHNSIADLTPLKGMRLETLDLRDCKLVTDFTPLEGMPLTKLDVRGTKFTDLAMLHGMPLTTLNMGYCETRDLGPLQGMPLTYLSLYFCTNVRDLTPLKGMQLTRLEIGATRVTDLSPIRGMPLKFLGAGTGTVTDLTPLEGMQLEGIKMSWKHITNGIDVVRNMKSINQIFLPGDQCFRPEVFWKKYDAGEFNK